MDRKQMTQSNRLLMWMGAGIAALVVVAAVIVIVSKPASFEAGTPEAVVQEYIEAILDDDPDTAWALLTPRLQARCEIEDIEPRYSRAERSRIILVDSRVRDETATVELEFNAAYGDGPFDIYESSYNQRFDLRNVDEAWRISDVPWPFYWCSGA